ncbi:PTS transport protein, component II [Salmonella bongori]|nr:PTS transport protein, component II [Salmonella bongori]
MTLSSSADFFLATGIDNVQLMAKGKPWYIYIINLGLQFSMYMVILLQGVRMMVGEINGSFKGWAGPLYS